MKDKLPNESEHYEGEDIEMTDPTESGEENIIGKYGKLVLIAAVSLIAIVGVMYYFSYSGTQKEEAAARELSRIRAYYDNGEFARALAGGDSVPTVRGDKVMGLLEISDTYSSTQSGRLASMLSGEALVNLNDHSQAKKYYDNATSAASEIVKRGSFAGLGVCYELESNHKEAARNYEKAAELSLEPGTKGRYMLYAALNYEKLGEKEKAEALLIPLTKDNEYFELSNLAKAALVRIGTIIE